MGAFGHRRRGAGGKPGVIAKSFFAPFLDLYRRLCRALESLPYEYESPKRFLGLPLLSINLGFDHPAGKMREARGIIAVGNLATGVIAMGIFVARGLFTIALVSYGAVSVSIAGVALLAVSIVGLGVVSVSVFAIGYLAVGILALGYQCVGIVSIGREAVGIIGIGQKVRALFSP